MINLITQLAQLVHGIITKGAGIVCWLSAGLVIERLRVRIPAGAAGEFSSPQSQLC